MELDSYRPREYIISELTKLRLVISDLKDSIKNNSKTM